jgi:hypothetical protein
MPIPRGNTGVPSAIEKGNCVTSLGSLRTCANSSGVPNVVFVDMQQEYLAKPEVSYRCDASASYALDDMSVDQVRRAVSRISGVYGDVI